MRMLIHFGLIGALVAIVGTGVVLLIGGAAELVWLTVGNALELGYGWLIWTFLAVGGAGFIGGVIFPFVVPPPKHQINSQSE